MTKHLGTCHAHNPAPSKVFTQFEAEYEAVQQAHGKVANAEGVVLLETLSSLKRTTILQMRVLTMIVAAARTRRRNGCRTKSTRRRRRRLQLLPSAGVVRLAMQ